MVTNGSMQADAFLFDALVEPGDSVIVERPTYDRTLLSLRNRGADVRMVELEHDGIDVAALERVLAAGVDAEARPHHPQLPEPGRLHAVGGQARAPAGARPRPRVHDLRGRSLRGAALRGLAAGRRCSRWTARPSCTPRPSPRPSARGSASATSSGPTELIARIVKIATSTYISPSMVSQGIVHQFCRSGALERSIETVKDALRERATTLCDALTRGAAARPASSRPRAATSCGSICRAAPTSTPCSTAGRGARRPVRQGL